MDTTFAASCLNYRGCSFFTSRRGGRDVIVARGSVPAGTPLADGQTHNGETVFPASYENMLAWERLLAPKRRLTAINRSGLPHGFGAGNRIVIAQPDLTYLGDMTTMAG